MDIQRRSFLQSVAAALGSLSLSSDAEARQLGNSVTPRSEAIRALRIVNTLQSWHIRKVKHFVSLADLMRHETAL